MKVTIQFKEHTCRGGYSCLAFDGVDEIVTPYGADKDIVELYLNDFTRCYAKTSRLAEEMEQVDVEDANGVLRVLWHNIEHIKVES